MHARECVHLGDWEFVAEPRAPMELEAFVHHSAFEF